MNFLSFSHISLKICKPCGEDNGVGEDGLGIGEDLEGSRGEIDSKDGLSEDLGAEVEGLVPATIHALVPKDAFWETRKILDVVGCGELAAGVDVFGHPTLEEDGLELDTRGVYSHGVGGELAKEGQFGWKNFAR